MSLSLYVIVNFGKCSSTYEDLQKISDACFAFIGEATRKKLAINNIRFRDGLNPYIEDNEVFLDISNSYIFCEAEKILRDDFSVPFPSHKERLYNLQQFLEYVISVSEVEKIIVLLGDEEEMNNYEKINCSLAEFASVMHKLLFQNFAYSYICEFRK